MARPKGRLSWASDELIDSGPEEDNPTKVNPGAAITAQGFKPGFRIPTGFLNHALAVVENEGTYQDAIEVQNWSNGRDIDNSTAGTDPICLAYFPGLKKMYFGYNDKIKASPLGVTWTLETLPASGPQDMAFIAANSSAMVAGGGVYAGFLIYSGSWALEATAGVNNYLCALAWNSGDVRFVLGAQLAAGTAPRIVTLDSDYTTSHISAKSMPSGYTVGVISHVAAASAFGRTVPSSNLSRCVVVAGMDAAGAAAGGLQSYYSDDGVVWTSNRITQITDEISDLWYDDCRELFYIIDQGGELFSSTDGITWTDTTLAISIDTAKKNVLAQYGGIWVACLESEALMWSVDAGVTWHEVLDPFTEGPTGTQPYLPRHVVLCNDRFACIASPSADDEHAISLSLHCR